MSAIETSIALVATLAALQACSHPAVTRPAAPAAADAVRAASDTDRARAQKLIQDEFAAEGVNPNRVRLRKSAEQLYGYTYFYNRIEGNLGCSYVAKGLVDVAFEVVTVDSNERTNCSSRARPR